jgi:hypothetical protein
MRFVDIFTGGMQMAEPDIPARFEDEARAAAYIDVRDNGDWATLDEDTWVA